MLDGGYWGADGLELTSRTKTRPEFFVPVDPVENSSETEKKAAGGPTEQRKPKLVWDLKAFVSQTLIDRTARTPNRDGSAASGFEWRAL